MALTLLTFAILILSVVVHEIAHGYMANSLGDPTARLSGRLTLNPIPHIDLVGSILIPVLLFITHSPMIIGWAKPVPYNPHNLKNPRWGEFLVSIAGVATNLVIAVCFGLAIHFWPLSVDSTALDAAILICYINLTLAFFNLIPIPPLDGFTAVRTLLPWKLQGRFAYFEQRLHGLGIGGLLILLILFSLLSDPFYRVVDSVFLLLAGR